MKLTISRMMLLFGVLVCTSVVVLVGLSRIALKEIEVNGPLDLVGDILPPPEYVIEAYLEANLAAQDPSTVGQRKSHISQLHHEYDIRNEYWAASDLPADLKHKLTQESNAQVSMFWHEVEDELLPAIERDNLADDLR